MKKLLTTTAIALVAMASTASAQSVLERVLGQIDNSTNLASVNGTFANIAENIGTPGLVNVYTNGSGDLITQAEYDAIANQAVATDYATVTVTAVDSFYVDRSNGDVISKAEFDALSAVDQAAYVDMAVAGVSGETDTQEFFVSASGEVITAAEQAALPADAAEVTGLLTAYTASAVSTGAVEGINGSITNVIDGIGETTQEAIASATVSATEYNMPTFDFGDMATTALGAVNTGEITLGVNSSVDNAKTTSTEAVSSVMEQLGGSTDTGAIVMNIASNMTGVNGSINNVMAELNGSMGNLSTTALGAVNTGEIISGVNAAVTGITGVNGASAGQ